MKKLTFLIILLLEIIMCVQSENINCLTGHKILVRQTVLNQNKQKQYKLSYKCLCPNNYYGNQCSYHIDLTCYLQPIKNLNPIDKDNAMQQMTQYLQFQLECWVPQNFNMKYIELRQFLSKYNQKNQFGVTNRISKGYSDSLQIIWANTTDIFNYKGQLKILNQTSNSSGQQNDTLTPTPQQIQKIIIGNNSKLYNTPFVYKDYFLSFGLINGQIKYHIKFINPTHGNTVKQILLNTSDLKVTGLEDYVNSYNQMKVLQDQRAQIMKNISDLNKNQSLNRKKIQDLIKQYFKSQKPNLSLQQLKKLNLNKQNFNPNQNFQKPLPIIKIPAKLNPYTQTFYQNIFIELSIVQNFQDNLKHTINMNSLIYNIPVHLQGVGLPSATSKRITVIDQNDKSYYKILVVILIFSLLFFFLKYTHKRYQEWKNKQYSQMIEQPGKGYEQSVKSTTNSSKNINTFMESSTGSQNNGIIER